jgi:hypothetical protein
MRNVSDPTTVLPLLVRVYIIFIQEWLYLFDNDLTGSLDAFYDIVYENLRLTLVDNMRLCATAAHTADCCNPETETYSKLLSGYIFE